MNLQETLATTLAGTSFGRWQLQANDNTRGGWLAFGVYLVLSYLCWREVLRQHSAGRNRVAGLSPAFWIALSTGITALGINKQLDFQTLILEIGSKIAKPAGVLAYKRLIEAGFALMAAVAAAFFANRLRILARRTSPYEKRVVVGVAGLLLFIWLRIASINHIELLPGVMGSHRPILAIELIVLSFLGFAVWRNSRET